MDERDLRVNGLQVNNDELPHQRYFAKQEK